jgi:hypothetical protein
VLGLASRAILSLPVPSDDVVHLRAYTPRLRAATAAVKALALANLLELAVRFVLDSVEPQELERLPLPLLVRRVVLFTVAPWLIWLIVRGYCRATLAADGSTLHVRAQWGSRDVPRPAAGVARPWRLPLPEPGLQLPATNAPLGFSWDAAPLVGVATSDDAAALRRMRRLHHPAIKLVLVPTALTFVLFRLHQIITYGGPMGEARIFGLRRWLNTLLGVTLYSFCTLLVVAVALRSCIEIVALLTSRLPPPWAGRTRVALEAAGATLYYGGLLALVVLRLGL